MQRHRVASSRFNSFDPPRGDLNPRGFSLRFHFVDQRFLYVSRKLQSAFELHFGRIGINRLRFREIDDRRKNLRRLKDLEIQSRLFRLNRRRNSRHPRPNDCQI